MIDARGHVLAPGFIDMHAHLDPLLNMPDAQSAARQGVTLALGGPDGGGPGRSAPTWTPADRAGLGINVAFLTGHNTIRRAVMGTANRAPTADELARMKRMVGQAMHEGAFGMSTGLRYIPGFYSKTDEVVALSKVAADSGGIYTSHLREEGLGLFEGVGEALEIGRQARIPIVLTHHKAIGQQMWGKSTVTLRMVDSARAAGTDVMIDQYPYTASSTSLDVLVPPWALEGGRAELQEASREPGAQGQHHARRDRLPAERPRRRRRQARAVRERGVGPHARRQDAARLGGAQGDRADAGEGGAAGTRRRAQWRRVDGVPRDRRGRRQAHHGASDDDDRERRAALAPRRGRAASRATTARSRAC